MNRQKLLIISDYFYPHWTGLAKSITYMLPSMTESAQVTVLTVAHKKDLPKEEIYMSAQIIRTKPQLTVSRSKYSLMQLLVGLSLIVKADTVFINSPSANMLPLSFVAFLVRKKLLVFHQGDLVLTKGLLNRLIEKVFDLSLFLCCLMAEKVTTYTKDYADNSRILKYFPKKAFTLIPPIYVNKNGGKKKKTYIGFAGRFVEEKGFDILLDAIPGVIQEIPSAHFIFAGQLTMDYEKFFEKNKSKFNQVKKYITNLGLLSSDSMTKFYSSLSLLVVPSRSDCFNLVQAEAMLSGIPIVVSDIPGARFLVQKTGFGKIFEKENSHDLAQKIILAVRELESLQSHYKNVVKVLDNKKNEESITKFIVS